MTKTLPLPPRFFKRPELTEREEQYLVGKAKESAKALVDATRNNEGPVRWEEAGMHRGVQMYKGEARYPETVVGESISYGCGATTIQSTLDEVADFFDLSTDAKVAEFVECNVDVLDAQLLYVIEDPSLLNDPKHNTRGQRSGSSKMLNANQVTVKWFASEMPSKLLKNRDFLTVECQSTFMDVSGRRGWVRSYHSIKLPCCPELSDYGLVRGSFYHTGHVFVESERPGFLDVIYSAQVNMKGSMKVPTPLFMTIQKKRLTSIADLQKMITRRRLGAQRFLGDLELVPKSQRTRCNLCSAKFGLITRKARCRKCGEVVCASACSTEWEVSIPGQGVRKVRVCSKCAQNTDPSVFEDLPPSEQYSETNSAHDDEPPLMSVRAPGYQYERYNRSDSGSSPTSRRRGLPSRDSDEYDSQGRGRRHHSGRRGPYSNSYDSQNDSFQDPDPEYPRTMEMPGEYGNVSLDSDRYTNDSAEYDDYPPSSRRRDDSRKYDPRNPDILLAQHTKQMGKPGPVTKNERNAARRVVQEERTRRKKPVRDPEPEPERPAPPSLSSDRPLTRLEQLQVAQWEQQEAMFRNQVPFDLELEAAEIVPSKPRRRRTGSSEGSTKRRGPELPAFFRSPHNSAHSQGHGAPTGESPPSKPPAFPTNSGQTVSVADDEDRLDYSAGRDDSINGLSMNFGSLLRPEDLRPTEESMCLSLDSSGQDHSAMGDSDAANPGRAGASAAKDRADVSKTTVVKLYQRILELTNKQHELEAQPESDPNEKKEIARELEELYEKLHSEVEI
ncbi:Hepatocyte growth factor-regulated tyrosine kinase substrate [Phytophthora nicotianae]|uniref:Hepatocyte growth factor-regulated tyrosine kinase substrate n=1 Tax=Phytophthora nicotianae TaxID=4792 RepID=A0A0W8D7M8_PHYNI|nr:Hepatocyte growth factor-regulated tyrosine kinase substrate [Phytophthora nicotianae]